MDTIFGSTWMVVKIVNECWLCSCVFVQQMSYQSIRMQNPGIEWCYVHGEQILGLKFRVLIDVFNEIEGMGAILYIGW